MRRGFSFLDVDEFKVCLGSDKSRSHYLMEKELC